MLRALLAVGVVTVFGILLWQAIAAGGVPDPTAPNTPLASAVVDIGVLVFREGLECILVLAAITASMVGASESYRRPIAAGVGVAFLATLLTWRIAIAIVDSLTDNLPALHLQVITGLLAIVVLLVVMNWFFHKIYWSGWISLHTQRKRRLLKDAEDAADSRSNRRLLIGLVMLGFTSFYREGFEVVLFLQNYRLKLGGAPVLYGVGVGVALSIVVAVLTFLANRRLPYKKMLIVTGALLAVVLLVMVGEQAQEMQLAHWLPTTPLPALERVLPAWLGLWLAIFPTAETLAAQAIAALLVLGSYFVVNVQLRRARATA
ncbi:MAG TPA: FTR1 family protein [Gemmatimonadaceae bacterium]|nr:FTR1 family protein [Gemmatimonadaceae bacterium]